MEKMKNTELCSANAECPVIEGIPNVKVKCESNPIHTRHECLLECEEEGLNITPEKYRALYCLKKDGKLGWQTKGGEIVTVEELKNMKFCTNDTGPSCPAIGPDDIPNVTVDCAIQPIGPGGADVFSCDLKCNEAGVKLTDERYKKIICKDEDGKSSWYTVDGDIAVTVEELKNMTLCPDDGTCEALKGIERVQTTCATGPTIADSKPLKECQLECENDGEFEKKDWKNLFCKTVNNISSWYTTDDERVTLKMIKDEKFCMTGCDNILEDIPSISAVCTDANGDIVQPVDDIYASGVTCKLNCTEEGAKIRPEYKQITCVNNEGDIGWQTVNGAGVSVEMLKNESLCVGKKTECLPISGVPRVNSSCPEDPTPVDKSCQLKCADSELTINETYSTIDCSLLEDGSAEWHVDDVKTTVEELRLKELCPPKDYCMELPSWIGVTVNCSNKEDTEKLAGDEVPKDGHCHLICRNGQNITEAYETLTCTEIDGELKFVRNNDSEPIVREVLAKIEFCQQPSGTILP